MRVMEVWLLFSSTVLVIINIASSASITKPVESQEQQRQQQESDEPAQPQLPEPKYMRVCYYTNWSQYRKQPGRFLPFNIDPYLCTHIIFSFSKIDYNGHLAPYEWNDIQYPHMYRQFNGLKKQNPKLRTLLAVGGWTHGSKPFTEMVKTDDGRQSFIDHAVQYLRTHNFDGLDLDWEYPANRGSPKDDKHRFSVLCKELEGAFAQESQRTGKEKLLLTAAVGGGEKIVLSAYEVPQISKHLDFINLMSYDLFGGWSKTLGTNAGLYPPANVEGKLTPSASVDGVVQLWLELGADPNKLVMGIPLYGRSFTVCSADKINLGDKNCGIGQAGPYTREKGFMSYYEIKQKLKEGYTRKWLDDQQVPIAYNLQQKQWIGYDDEESVRLKAEYIKKHNLAGAMVWAVDLDDFGGMGGEINPLTRTIRSTLEEGVVFPKFVPPPKPEKRRLIQRQRHRILKKKKKVDKNTPKETKPYNLESKSDEKEVSSATFKGPSNNPIVTHPSILVHTVHDRTAIRTTPSSIFRKRIIKIKDSREKPILVTTPKIIRTLDEDKSMDIPFFTTQGKSIHQNKIGRSTPSSLFRKRIIKVTDAVQAPTRVLTTKSMPVHDEYYEDNEMSIPFFTTQPLPIKATKSSTSNPSKSIESDDTLMTAPRAPVRRTTTTKATDSTTVTTSSPSTTSQPTTSTTQGVKITTDTPGLISTTRRSRITLEPASISLWDTRKTTPSFRADKKHKAYRKRKNRKYKFGYKDKSDTYFGALLKSLMSSTSTPTNESTPSSSGATISYIWQNQNKSRVLTTAQLSTTSSPVPNSATTRKVWYERVSKPANFVLSQLEPVTKASFKHPGYFLNSRTAPKFTTSAPVPPSGAWFPMHVRSTTHHPITRKPKEKRKPKSFKRLFKKYKNKYLFPTRKPRLQKSEVKYPFIHKNNIIWTMKPEQTTPETALRPTTTPRVRTSTRINLTSRRPRLMTTPGQRTMPTQSTTARQKTPPRPKAPTRPRTTSRPRAPTRPRTTSMPKTTSRPKTTFRPRTTPRPKTTSRPSTTPRLIAPTRPKTTPRPRTTNGEMKITPSVIAKTAKGKITHEPTSHFSIRKHISPVPTTLNIDPYATGLTTPNPSAESATFGKPPKSRKSQTKIKSPFSKEEYQARQENNKYAFKKRTEEKITISGKSIKKVDEIESDSWKVGKMPDPPLEKTTNQDRHNTTDSTLSGHLTASMILSDQAWYEDLTRLITKPQTDNKAVTKRPASGIFTELQTKFKKNKKHWSTGKARIVKSTTPVYSEVVLHKTTEQRTNYITLRRHKGNKSNNLKPMTHSPWYAKDIAVNKPKELNSITKSTLETLQTDAANTSFSKDWTPTSPATPVTTSVTIPLELLNKNSTSSVWTYYNNATILKGKNFTDWYIASLVEGELPSASTPSSVLATLPSKTTDFVLNIDDPLHDRIDELKKIDHGSRSNVVHDKETLAGMERNPYLNPLNKFAYTEIRHPINKDPRYGLLQIPREIKTSSRTKAPQGIYGRMTMSPDSTLLEPTTPKTVVEGDIIIKKGVEEIYQYVYHTTRSPITMPWDKLNTSFNRRKMPKKLKSIYVKPSPYTKTKATDPKNKWQMIKTIASTSHFDSPTKVPQVPVTNTKMAFDEALYNLDEEFKYNNIDDIDIRNDLNYEVDTPQVIVRKPSDTEMLYEDFRCPTVFGIYADVKNCQRFYQCVWFVSFHHHCGQGTVWNDKLKICDWPKRRSCIS